MSTMKYYGLSLSERLSKAGISHSFSAAIKAKDSEKMKTLLISIEYSDDSANAMIETFLGSHETFSA